MAPMTKLGWQKALRGADLTPTEYMVLLTISTYADKHLKHAHPGWNRLVNDTQLDVRTIKKAVSSLIEKEYLVLAVPGGNQYRKGQANEYHLTLPASTTPSPRGTPNDPLDNLEGVHLVQQGVHPVHPRGTSGAWEGVHPVPPHQVLSSGPYIKSNHHSATDVAGALAPAPARAQIPKHDTTDWDALLDDEELLQEWLDERFGGIDQQEAMTAYYMWESGQHPIAIFNTIAKQRRQGEAS